MRTGVIAVVLILAVAAGDPALRAQSPPQQPPAAPPVFKGGTDVIAVDVSVSQDTGDPVPGLTATDFKVEVDGKPRQVVSAEWMRQDQGPSDAVSAGRAAITPGQFSSNEAATGGRLVLLVFDVEGMPAGGGRNVAAAAAKFLDQLAPTDQVGLVEVPRGVNIPFTASRGVIREALDRVVGQGTPPPANVRPIGISEAYEIERGDTLALQRAVARECSDMRLPPGAVNPCPGQIEQDARTVAQVYRSRSEVALRTYESLVASLEKIDGPKTIVWISGGVPVPFTDLDLGAIAARASAAHATTYAVHLDTAVLGVDASQGQRSPTLMEDRTLKLHGLEVMAGVTRGAVFSSTSDGTTAFNRIAREMRAYYLLGVEALPTDRDGKRHRIKVAVERPGLSVRARREFTAGAPAAEAGHGTPEEQVRSVLEAPLVATELALRVATYSLRAPDAGMVRVLVASDIGRREEGPLQATIGYVVATDAGRMVLSKFAPSTAELTDPATPGPVHTSVAVDLPPGKYRLRLAVVDAGGRRGSVEHTFEAGLGSAGSMQVADLMLTPPLKTEDATVKLTAAPVVETSSLDAYLELYGGSSASTRVRIEVADTDAGPALAHTDLPIGQSREPGHFGVEGPLPIGLLPPGAYVARAVVSAGGSSVSRVRRFAISRPAPADDVFKQALHDRVGVFDPKSVLTADLLGPAVARALELDGTAASNAARAIGADVSAGRLGNLRQAASLGSEPSVLASFLRGLNLYQSGSVEDAAGQFRAAVRASPDFLPGIFYLGACYAKGGRVRESIGAWQTALTGDEPRPEVYQMIADAYLRLGEADDAADLLAEAGGRWPEDARFAITSALARAANGHPDEALTGLKPWLDRPSPDPEALALAARLAVATLATSTDQNAAAARVRDLAGRVTASGQPLDPLVSRWLAYLASGTVR